MLIQLETTPGDEVRVFLDGKMVGVCPRSFDPLHECAWESPDSDLGLDDLHPRLGERLSDLARAAFRLEATIQEKT